MGCQKLTRYPHITTRPGWDVGLDSDRIDLWPWFAQSRRPGIVLYLRARLAHLIRSKMVGYPAPVWPGGETGNQAHGYHGSHCCISPRIKGSGGGSAGPGG